jgi:hypothetical protein
MSLRETLNPALEAGAEADVEVLRAAVETSRKRVAELEGRQKGLGKDAPGSVAAGTELRKVSDDVRDERMYLTLSEREFAIKTVELARMKRELAWLDKDRRGAPEPYDLRLAVDRSYILP